MIGHNRFFFLDFMGLFVFFFFFREVKYITSLASSVPDRVVGPIKTLSQRMFNIYLRMFKVGYLRKLL